MKKLLTLMVILGISSIAPAAMDLRVETPGTHNWGDVITLGLYSTESLQSWACTVVSDAPAVPPGSASNLTYTAGYVFTFPATATNSGNNLILNWQAATAGSGISGRLAGFNYTLPTSGVSPIVVSVQGMQVVLAGTTPTVVREVASARIAVVPEPASLALLVLGGTALLRRRHG